MKNKILKVLLFPIYIIEIVSIKIYKLCISPFLNKSCRFIPTCSTYGMQALKEFGPIKGLYLTAKRLIRCNPKSKGGYDPIPINIKGEHKWLI